ncbi:MAG TPA: phosphate/phosphite/phosphonate ABC transporter substrate-binding protein [Thermodesulfovibrionales bacterium]|nr:phosphate/phosphite/phosphonate ABC transporter substrate-binding protein [Thermodesulfovibrionales bacterium]
MSRKLFVLALIVLGLLCVIACEKKEEPRRISLEQRESAPKTVEHGAGKNIRIAVGGMITPREGLAYYKNFLLYIGDKLGRHVDFVDREDYGEINGLLEKGDIDAAFVCSGPYVDGRKAFGLELVAAPQAYGGTVYYSYIIVAKNSPISNFKGLRGKKFAFTDPLSNTGKLVPTFMLAQMNETPETFFKSYTYTKSHDKAIKAVALGMADGAAVDSLIWEYLNRTKPEVTSKTRIMTKSAPYAIPPVVVPRGLDRQLKESLKQILLNAHNDEKGRVILKHMMIEKFVPIDDRAYDSIREMKSWVERQERKK